MYHMMGLLIAHASSGWKMNNFLIIEQRDY